MSSQAQQPASPRGGSTTLKEKARGRGPRLAPRAAGAGVWDIPEWCAAMGIGYSTFWTLKERPLSVRIGRLGRLCKIVESPGDYARRVAAMQEQIAERSEKRAA